MRFEESIDGAARRSELAISPTRMRLDVLGTPYSQIIDLSAWEVFNLNTETKGGSRSKLDVPRDREPGQIEVTGAVDTLLGRPCDVWRLNFAGSRVEACVDREIAGFAIFARYTGNTTAIRLLGGPLPLVAKPLPGKQQIPPLRVTSIDRVPVAAARFEVPTDYKIVGRQSVDDRRIPAETGTP